MKIKCQREILLNSLNDVVRLVSVRSTLPILQNILLKTTKTELILRSTDLEQTLEKKIPVEVKEIGEITVPARLFAEFLTNNTDEVVELSTEENNLSVTSSKHQAKLLCTAAQEYPDVPIQEKPNKIIINGKILREIITKTLFASSLDDSRPILNSLLFRFKENYLEVVGTDGYRLAFNRIEFRNTYQGDCIIPRKALQEVVRLIPESEIELSFGETQFLFTFNGTLFLSRLLEGNYPDYEAIMPKSHRLSIEVDSSQLLQSLRLASLFSRDSAYSCKMEISNTTLKIIATSPTLGENSNQITLKKAIEAPFKISFNSQYLIDFLNIFKDNITLSFNDDKSPIVARRGLGEDYLYLIMPLRN